MPTVWAEHARRRPTAARTRAARFSCLRRRRPFIDRGYGILFASAPGRRALLGESVPPSATGGDDRGGFANIKLPGGSVTIGGALFFSADGYGGEGRDGGRAVGGDPAFSGRPAAPISALTPSLRRMRSAEVQTRDSAVPAARPRGVAYIQSDMSPANSEVPANGIDDYGR